MKLSEVHFHYNFMLIMFVIFRPIKTETYVQEILFDDAVKT